MRRLEDYFYKSYAYVPWIASDDRPHDAVTMANNRHDEEISELKRKIKELQDFIEATYREENLSCDIKELI